MGVDAKELPARGAGERKTLANAKSPALLVADIIVGIVMILYALVAHLIIPGIPFALMILGGILLIWTGVAYR